MVSKSRLGFSRSKPFPMKASAPSSISFRPLFWDRLERTTTGMWAVRPFFFRERSTSGPLSLGNSISSKISCGRLLAASSKASSPSTAQITRYPALARMRSVAARKNLLSSTSKIVSIWINSPSVWRCSISLGASAPSSGGKRRGRVTKGRHPPSFEWACRVPSVALSRIRVSKGCSCRCAVTTAEIPALMPKRRGSPAQNHPCGTSLASYSQRLPDSSKFGRESAIAIGTRVGKWRRILAP